MEGMNAILEERAPQFIGARGSDLPDVKAELTSVARFNKNMAVRFLN